MKLLKTFIFLINLLFKLLTCPMVQFFRLLKEIILKIKTANNKTLIEIFGSKIVLTVLLSYISEFLINLYLLFIFYRLTIIITHICSSIFFIIFLTIFNYLNLSYFCLLVSNFIGILTSIMYIIHNYFLSSLNIIINIESIIMWISVLYDNYLILGLNEISYLEKNTYLASIRSGSNGTEDSIPVELDAPVESGIIKGSTNIIDKIITRITEVKPDAPMSELNSLTQHLVNSCNQYSILPKATSNFEGFLVDSIRNIIYKSPENFARMTHETSTVLPDNWGTLLSYLRNKYTISEIDKIQSGLAEKINSHLAARGSAFRYTNIEFTHSYTKIEVIKKP